MPTLTIDRRQVTVPLGTSVLDAAAQLGLEIPTLCFLDGYEPSTSCQVCMVKDLSTGRLVSACATKVVEGMRIESETDEVHSVRRTALELLLSDHVGDCVAPCFFACPAHMDIPLMLRQIGDEHLRQAIATIKRDIALPAVLGRVCPRPCEKGCRRGTADDPVAVCELKRYVADADLACDEPYLPACKPATGKRVAIVGAGPTGLSAAYYLRQQGHACVLLDDQTCAGGRLHRDTEAEHLPHEVLDAEIRQILRLGVELQTGCAVRDEQGLDELCREFDAVLLACGEVSADQVEQWGLAAGKRGIEVDRHTFQTRRPGVFAAGNAIRGKGLVVRSVADGKEVAAVLGQFLLGEPLAGGGRPFASRMGPVAEHEVSQLVALKEAVPRDVPCGGCEYGPADAAAQSARCLVCGCPSHGNCKLERYAAAYGADPGRYAGVRRPLEVIGRGSSVLFEPGKCIKCELCVQIAARAGEPLGLAFVGRGFDVRVDVPFQRGMDKALTKVADQCVTHCPTGALYFARDRVAPDNPAMKRIHIVGRKNSGKTTLIVDLVQHLRLLGYSVGTVKHTHHRHELDTPGKDSYRHRVAGSVITAIISPATTALFWSTQPGQATEERYRELDGSFAACDVVLVEGDAGTDSPKIEVWRASLAEAPLSASDTSIRALITDDPVQACIPLWSRVDVAGLAKHVLAVVAP